MAVLFSAKLRTSTVNEGVKASGVLPNALGRSAGGIANKGDYKVSPDCVESSFDRFFLLLLVL